MHPITDPLIAENTQVGIHASDNTSKPSSTGNEQDLRSGHPSHDSRRINANKVYTGDEGGHRARHKPSRKINSKIAS